MIKKYMIMPLGAMGLLALSMLACGLGAFPAPAVTASPLEATTVVPATGAPVLEAPDASGACSNPYLPIKTGASWTYKLTGPIPDTFTRSIISTEAGGFSDQDVFGTGATRKGQWTCDGGSLTALDPANGNSASVNSNNVTTDFHTTESSGVTIPAVLNSGDTWTQTTTLEGTRTINDIQAAAKNQFSNTCKVTGLESVTVEAGTFNALRFDCQTVMNISIDLQGTPIQTTMNFNSMNWYVENIGLVKTVTTGEGLDTTIELVSYNIP